MDTEKLSTKHKIAICDQGGCLRVVPGQREAEEGDWVTFYNLHAGPVDVLIPGKDLFGETKILRIKKGGKSEALEVTKDAVGCYPYAVYDPVTREFGHASVPIIIIYPRRN